MKFILWAAILIIVGIPFQAAGYGALVVLQKCWRYGKLGCIEEQPRSSLHEPAESV